MVETPLGFDDYAVISWMEYLFFYFMEMLHSQAVGGLE